VDYSVKVGWGHDRGYVNLRPTFSESSFHTLHSPRWMYATIFTAFMTERDTGRKLAENRARFYTPCLFSTPDWDDHTSQFQKKNCLQSSRLGL